MLLELGADLEEIKAELASLDRRLGEVVNDLPERETVAVEEPARSGLELVEGWGRVLLVGVLALFLLVKLAFESHAVPVELLVGIAFTVLCASWGAEFRRKDGQNTKKP